MSPEELEALYDRYSGAMYALALRVTGDRDTASRALESAFIAVWSGSVGTDSASLMRAARDHALAQGTPAKPLPPVAQPTPRLLIEHAFFGGKRVDELARAYKMPEGEVRNLLRNGIRELRNQFGAAR